MGEVQISPEKCSKCGAGILIDYVFNNFCEANDLKHYCVFCCLEICRTKYSELKKEKSGALNGTFCYPTTKEEAHKWVKKEDIKTMMNSLFSYLDEKLQEGLWTAAAIVNLHKEKTGVLVLRDLTNPEDIGKKGFPLLLKYGIYDWKNSQ